MSGKGPGEDESGKRSLYVSFVSGICNHLFGFIFGNPIKNITTNGSSAIIFVTVFNIPTVFRSKQLIAVHTVLINDTIANLGPPFFKNLLFLFELKRRTQLSKNIPGYKVLSATPDTQFKYPVRIASRSPNASSTQAVLPTGSG